MKLISWNVNGLRAIMKKNFKEFLAEQQPDFLCLQETKISASALAEIDWDFAGYQAFWNPAKRPGYSGTLTLVKDPDQLIGQPLGGFGVEKFDDEGRTQILELADFFLINAYFPNANAELSRLGYKLEYNELMLNLAKELKLKKPVVICGDYNVAHRAIDLARPKDNEGSAGFTAEEREWMDRFLANGFSDTFRHCHGDEVKYSWWSYRAGARQRNVGWRIDYFCASNNFLSKIKKAEILDKVLGSDHCPVLIEI